MTIKEAESIVGTLSKPSKMPCHGYSISAKRCKVGVKMRNVKNSTCGVCYALKGRYNFSNVQNAMEKRYQSLFLPEWVETISWLIDVKEQSGFFRWHDAGDIQGVWHLDKIVEVANNLPHIQFWLPTREYIDNGEGETIVQDWIEANWPKSWGGAMAQGARGGPFPKNLTVRLSALMIDGPAPKSIAKRLGLTCSGVSVDDWNCPASEQENFCRSCRKCWDKSVPIVNYKKH